MTFAGGWPASGSLGGGGATAATQDTQKVVADQTARFALTTDEENGVQNGDTVYQTDTQATYLVVDDTNLYSSAGYHLLPPAGVEFAGGPAFDDTVPRFENGKLAYGSIYDDGNVASMNVLNLSGAIQRSGSNRITFSAATGSLMVGGTTCALWGGGSLGASLLMAGATGVVPARAFEARDSTNPQMRLSDGIATVDFDVVGTELRVSFNGGSTWFTVDTTAV